MPVLKIQGFSGTIPVTGDRALPDGFAAESFNTWLYGNELRGARPPKDVIAIQTTTRTVLRVPRNTPYPTASDPIPPPSFIGNDTWKQFQEHDVDIVRGQLVDDLYDRWYFCSPLGGPKFNTYARMVTGLPDYKLGVPGPNTDIAADGTNADAPVIVSIVGGAAPMVTRAYVYTWVNEFGEESSSSLPVIGAGNFDAVWTIGNIKDPPALGVDYPAYTKKRVYRTVTGASGQTTFYRVSEHVIGATLPDGGWTSETTFADNTAVMTDAVLVNQLRLESISWAPPPPNMKGWIAMPNGFLVGFDDSNIYMSEQYHFHAWPPEYKIATEYPIVGLGILGETCVVCTQGFPATITGAKPATCSLTKATTGEPCLSRGSIVSTPQGIVYASHNGLIMISPQGIENITSKLITRDEWLSKYEPAYIRAQRYQNGYLSLRMKDAPGNRSAFFLDPTELRVALTEFTDMQDLRNVNVDFWSGEVFLVFDGMLKRWDAPSETDLMPVQWKSKEFQFPYQENFGAYAIYWDDDRFSNYPFGVSVLPVDQKVRFKVYADRRVVYDQLVPKNGRPIRLPAGFKADIWQFEIRARAPVYSMHVASTVKELRSA